MTRQEAKEEQQEQPVLLTLHDSIPIYFSDDWNTGIGGGLWSTGSALIGYLEHSHFQSNLCSHPPSSILELGSGNGVLSVCLAATLKRYDMSPRLLVVTDLEDHLPLMSRTIDANPQCFDASKTSVRVQEHTWGGNLEDSINDNQETFDWIVGSDLAYKEFCYEPLIQSLQRFSHDDTIVLLGVTMMDTTPLFFDKLDQHGFCYQKLHTMCLDVPFRGDIFGIFVIQKAASATRVRS